jgi:hypothetical protein
MVEEKSKSFSVSTTLQPEYYCSLQTLLMTDYLRFQRITKHKEVTYPCIPDKLYLQQTNVTQGSRSSLQWSTSSFLNCSPELTLSIFLEMAH